MANNLSTGIGLSGQFDYSQTGLEPVLQAERDLAGRRAQEQQQKNKERKALLDEIKKVTLMDHGLKIPLYQRQWESTMADAMTEIVDKAAKGEDDAYAAAWNLQRRMKNYTQDLKAADEELYNVYEAVRKNPEKYAWNDPQEIMEKTYNNFFEVLKDPLMADVNNMREAMKYYGGTEYLLQENDPESISRGAPPFTVHYNPQEMVNPLDYAMELAKEKAQYDQIEMGKPFMVGGKMRAEEVYRMSPETIGLLTDEAFQNMGVLRNYEERLFKNRPDKSMTRAEFQKTDWIEDAKLLHEQEIKPQLQRMATRQGTIDVTPPAPKEAKPSAAQKNADRWASAGSYSDDGKTWVVSLNLPTGRTYGNAKIPKGATYTNDKGEEQKVPADVTLEATPIGFEWRGPSDSYFLVQSKLDPKGQSIGGIDQMYEYRIPVSRVNADNFGTLMGTNREGAMKKLLEGSQDGPVNDIKKWAEQMGVDPSGLLGSSQGAAPTRPAQGNNTKENKFAKYGGTVR